MGGQDKKKKETTRESTGREGREEKEQQKEKDYERLNKFLQTKSILMHETRKKEGSKNVLQHTREEKGKETRTAKQKLI